jgi:predicted TIM-barrel fold metal-dependent hydrolase
MEADDWLISVDDHVIEPGNVWVDRLPANRRDAGPNQVLVDGKIEWTYEDRIFRTTGLFAGAGKRTEEFSHEPIGYEDMRPGCYDPIARLADMDRDGVLASLNFPSFPRFCGQTFLDATDRELALLCVRAYNDWMIDEWSASAPGRYIPGIIIPLWDAKLAAKEVERSADKGAKAILFSENPARLGLPSLHSPDRYWDPLIQAACDTGLPFCTHIGSSSSMPNTADDAPFVLTTATQAVNLMLCTADWIFSGVLSRFPGVKLCLSEGGIGWIPYLLERMDQVVEKQKHWASKGQVTRTLGVTGKRAEMPSNWDFETPPSVLFREHIYGCFIEEDFGVRVIDDIGVENVMIETDYPHTDSTWPNSQQIAQTRLASRTSAERHLILRGNAERVFNFTPAAVPVAV